MKKLLKNKNRSYKIVNNHKIQIYHKIAVKNHNVNKGWEDIYRSLSPIYQQLENDYSAIDMIDLIFYERWLNGEY